MTDLERRAAAIVDRLDRDHRQRKANADLDKIIQRLGVEESCCATGLRIHSEIVVAIRMLRTVVAAEERHQASHTLKNPAYSGRVR